MVAMKTCFPPLLFSLMFPHLERIQAFNRGGMDWTRMKETKADYSEVGIAVAADGTMFAIYCLKNSRQVDLRIRMLVVDPSVQFFGACEDLPNTNAARAQSNASAKALKQAKSKKTGVQAHFVQTIDGRWLCLDPVHDNCKNSVTAGTRYFHRLRYHEPPQSGASAGVEE